jgi:glucokinase
MSDKGVGMYVLCGDVGGTNSRLQLHGAAAGAVGVCQATGEKETDHGSARSPLSHSGFTLVAEHVFQSADFASLGGLVSAFLEKIKFGGVIDSACIAVCGPVENEQHMSGECMSALPGVSSTNPDSSVRR